MTIKKYQKLNLNTNNRLKMIYFYVLNIYNSYDMMAQSEYFTMLIDANCVMAR